MRLTKKAQGSVEFMIIFGGILFFFITFFAIIQNNIQDKNEDKERIILQSIALDVKDEINLAAESSEGYFREFQVPRNILGNNYEINITNNFVYVLTEKYGFAYQAFEVNGLIKKGTNNITKQNGIVYLNSVEEPGESPEDPGVDMGEIDTIIAILETHLSETINEKLLNIINQELSEAEINEIVIEATINFLNDYAGQQLSQEIIWNLEEFLINATATCEESDNGYEATIKGDCKDLWAGVVINTFIDSCESKKILGEYSCIGINPTQSSCVLNKVECSADSCENGVCKKGESTSIQT